MKIIPMIFNQQMVQALAEGRKTVTRRPMKLETKDCDLGCLLKPNEVAGEVNNDNFQNASYRVGDLIWVRETFQAYVDDENEYLDADFKTGKGVTVSYPATDKLVEIVDIETGNSSCRKKPSIHMPRWASRLTLRVTDVRCERVQNITEAQAKYEGVFPARPSSLVMPYYISFMDLWEDLYKNWCKNPWVWVIEFDVIKQNVDSVK
ncbi:ASCH domain-containing protein [Pseudoalteromonas prydzensis]|uniref:hypothetical protein n=1 Tax=Pseudoalteromonas prydzensis TaxID=182141 RepID=UPI0007E51693|nr:hypothetical protein [Pseudoalteromonas prydzensis]MBE0379215.1 hypothetical protein [Pseudoalteromonas prydzensis ACAM 620]